MSAFWVTLLFTTGASTWIYTKLQRLSGNNTQQSAIATSVAGVFIFIIFYFIAHSIIK